MRNPSKCDSDCDKASKIDEYLDIHIKTHQKSMKSYGTQSEILLHQ